MSSLAPAPEGAGARAGRAGGPERAWHAKGDALLGLAIAAAFTLLAFTTTGGVALASNTWAEIALVALAAGLGIAVAVTRPPRRGAGGRATLALAMFAALAALTFASIAWSVQPALSWVEANRTLSYLAAFAAAMALARLAPGRGAAMLGGVALYSVIVSVYALATKVFPGTLDPADALARVRAPFDYYNATGLAAAMAIPAWTWLGARREARTGWGRGLAVAAAPAIAALVCALLLSYGRGAVGAALVAMAVWFGFTPLRLRGVLVLVPGVLVGVVAALWATQQPALSNDHTALAARIATGHRLGVVLLVALLVAIAAGWAVTVVLARPALPAPLRRRIGIVLVSALALIPLGGVLALATSARGFGGEVSHLWDSLTNPNGFVLDQPGRLAQLGSSRPRYWRDGLRVGEHAPLAGTGAFGFATAVFRYSADHVLEAHSYVIQTFADFGVLGLLVSAGLLAAWTLAVLRTLRRSTGPPADPGGPPASPGHDGAARAGAVTLLAIVVAFGVHSTIDWTWFIPGVAVPALLCAGWLAGRGPLGLAAPAPEPARAGAWPVGGAVALGAAALIAGWIVWQPLRSSDADAAAVSALVRGDAGAAFTSARTAAAANPVDYVPHQYLSAIYLATGDGAAARRELVTATNLQPSNPNTWLLLYDFDLAHHRSGEAQRALARFRELAPHGL